MVVGEFAQETDLLVIGAGPGGYVAAIRGAQLGLKVTVVERENVGGVCLNVGCIPSKALITAGHNFQHAKGSDSMGITSENVAVDFSKVQSWKQSVVNKLTGGVGGLLKGNNVETVVGEAYFQSEDTVRIINEDSSTPYKFKKCIIATGSTPIELPAFKWSKRVLSSTGALNLPELPKKLIVIGGGYIGMELGTAYANFDTEVVILEGTKDILSGFEPAMTQVVKKKLKQKGNITIHNEALAQSVEETEEGVKVTFEVKGETQTVEADYVLVTVGRRPNTSDLGLEMAEVKVSERGLVEIDDQCRTSNENIYAIGDIVPGPPLAHKASFEAKIAAEAAAGHPAYLDYSAIPAVVFTDPELATVGYTEAQAKEEGLDYLASKFPYAANGRALALNEPDGFLKMITRKSDNLLIGAQIAGTGASDMIAEMGLAIESGMTAEDIALTIHAHPSLGEIAMETAEVAIGSPIHIIK
ncbi:MULTISPECIES: dihydrolipoyl dehydrogenase [Exiguobacterium]|uniref:Dihydrolipoyl dehydrogenase n=1 Tax=Exiguobacterium antarcticum TaxID=132920 RepID=A0ABT6QYG7_9BACL|nr:MULTISPECIES: dihydrolipoyl dehydrogenase [Exiguobacterium]AFS70965.1 Dihydrolipoyl dehydrogenase [Exiguobacterium antarcticum B7]MCT4780164.1 dihydrolipoyl dehydrogenase [Exiguobacterium soli]MDI3233720.1 dihydrolipoyl dehydrogenase [Exiguobacterium antarcticum]